MFTEIVAIYMHSLLTYTCNDPFIVISFFLGGGWGWAMRYTIWGGQNSVTVKKIPCVQIQPSDWRLSKMSIEHTWEYIGWLWSNAMNNRRAFVKVPNEWTQIDCVLLFWLHKQPCQFCSLTPLCENYGIFWSSFSLHASHSVCSSVTLSCCG